MRECLFDATFIVAANALIGRRLSGSGLAKPQTLCYSSDLKDFYSSIKVLYLADEQISTLARF